MSVLIDESKLFSYNSVGSISYSCDHSLKKFKENDSRFHYMRIPISAKQISCNSTSYGSS